MFTDLRAALSEDLSSINPQLSGELRSMFISDNDVNFDGAYKRFSLARKLYQDVMRNQSFNHTVFYKLGEKETLDAQYTEADQMLQDALIVYVSQLTNFPTQGQIKTFFVNKRLETDIFRNYIDALFLREPNIFSQLCIADENAIREWFNGRFEVPAEVSEEEFYNLRGLGLNISVENARSNGFIYHPGNDTDHNWGVNVAWCLAVLSRLPEIHLLSTLEDQHGTRRRQQNNPSAFALEIAMAISMDYRIKFNQNGTTSLTPPNELNYIQTTGIPGIGVIPTIDAQRDIFRHCVLSSEIYRQDTQSLINRVYTICTQGLSHEQYDLIEALRFISDQQQILILNRVGYASKGQLRRILQGTEFDDPKYRLLKENCMPSLNSTFLPSFQMILTRNSGTNTPIQTVVVSEQPGQIQNPQQQVQQQNPNHPHGLGHNNGQ